LYETRPDVVGEVRGEEAIDMLQAMNTGHEGSLTTIHANSPRDALTRLETMIAMGELNLPERAVRHQISSAINVIVQVSRLPDGSRKIMTISEVTGMEGPIITMQDIFTFQRLVMTRIIAFETFAHGYSPKFLERLESRHSIPG
jgi:pilus assembly protein CpaF